MVIADPADGQTWNGFRRGNKITHPMYGECEFYRYDSVRNEVEVFDRYGLLRRIPSDFFQSEG